MSSIKELLVEEKNAESSLKDAERQAEAILIEAKTKARELLRKAQNDNTLVNEMMGRYEQKVAESKEKMLKESQGQITQAETLYKKNFQRAVAAIVDEVLRAEEH